MPKYIVHIKYANSNEKKELDKLVGENGTKLSNKEIKELFRNGVNYAVSFENHIEIACSFFEKANKIGKAYLEDILYRKE